ELPDSIENKLLQNKLVENLEYQKIYYKFFGNLKLEGWAFNSFYVDLDPSNKHENLISHRIGTWKEYYRNGDLRSIEYIPLNDSAIALTIFYDKKGRKKAEHRKSYAEQNEILVNDNDYSRLSFNKKYNRRKFYKNDNLKYDINFCNLK